jgi:glucose-6-phosphate 1-dehydrogenase
VLDTPVRERIDPASATGGAPPAPPCAMVIFGAAGDLTARLLVPSLYNLARSGLLPDAFAVIGVARAEKATERFRGEVDGIVRRYASTAEECAACDWLGPRTYYQTGTFEDPATYAALRDRLAEVARRHGTGGSVLFYLATAPDYFAPIVRRLAAAGLLEEAEGGGWRRVIVEKPFGRDLDSALALNRELRRFLREDQIWRIDHYLGKETVQNILVFRFANGMFEPVWNRDHIDHVQITVAETVGVEQRGTFYDATGALRDMVPNHLAQLLALIAMEPPTCFAADAVRAEKVKVLEAVRHLAPEDAMAEAVRAQYGPGEMDGKPVPGYREEPQVAPDSTTATYVALKLVVDNWRWAGTPFYLRTGKRLAKRVSEIAVQFKPAPHLMFRGTAVERMAANQVVMHIQPDEGVSLRFEAKVPGPTLRVGDVAMRFNYRDYFEAPPRTGYERLIYDCMTGDATLFQRADFVEAGWSIVQPLLDAWAAHPAEGLAAYPAGSWGPPEADALLERDGRRWRTIA